MHTCMLKHMHAHTLYKTNVSSRYIQANQTLTNDIVKNSCFHDIQQSGPGIIRHSFHYRIPTVAVILFPTKRRKYNNWPCSQVNMGVQ